VPEFNLEDYKIVGNYMCMTNNVIGQGFQVEMGLPLFATNQPSAVARKIAWFNSGTGLWEIATSNRSTDAAVYGMLETRKQ